MSHANGSYYSTINFASVSAPPGSHAHTYVRTYTSARAHAHVRTSEWEGPGLAMRARLDYRHSLPP